MCIIWQSLIWLKAGYVEWVETLQMNETLCYSHNDRYLARHDSNLDKKFYSDPFFL